MLSRLSSKSSSVCELTLSHPTMMSGMDALGCYHGVGRRSWCQALLVSTILRHDKTRLRPLSSQDGSPVCSLREENRYSLPVQAGPASTRVLWAGSEAYRTFTRKQKILAVTRRTSIMPGAATEGRQGAPSPFACVQKRQTSDGLCMLQRTGHQRATFRP